MAVRAGLRSALLALLGGAALVGCGLGGLFGTDAAGEAAHAVFLTRPGCAYLVTNEDADDFAVLAPTDGSTFEQGDLLVGNLRDGGVALGIVPRRSEEIERRLSFEVVGRGIPLAEAQDLYYARCPPPADTIPSTGLPLAPEGVPVGVPPDTTGS